jgi:hypothetical protein
MIAKHVPMRAVACSDFAGLAAYITDEQDTAHRLGQITITNCAAASLQAVIGEVLATQRQNTRAGGDKTFHLLVSFRAGEAPGSETLTAIEARLCAGLGYGDHQRVSAVHRDTDNLHLHIAINKIHPERHTMHEPFQSYRTLAALCAALEREYGLQPDNHLPRRSVAEGRAADMECHAGIESLLGWVRRHCLEALRAAPSWAALHQVLHENGLVLRARGNGLVVEASDGTRVKASTLARELSRPSLEARLGPFEAPPDGPRPGPPDEPREGPATAGDRRHYDKAPLPLRVDTAALYARYQAEQQRRLAERTDALASARQRKARAIEAARRTNRLWRATIKVADGKGIDKRLLYAQASRALRAQLAAIHAAYANARETLYGGFQRRAWADWLKHEALHGNAEALAALRAREAARGLQGNTVTGGGGRRSDLGCVPDPLSHDPLVRDTITKKGTILYRAGASAVRDDGDRLQVADEATREGVQIALRLALTRLGPRITVSGTPIFKAQVIRAAVDLKLPLTFTDPALELRRQQLSSKEPGHEHALHVRRDGAERGRADRRRVGGAGDGATVGAPRRGGRDARGGAGGHAPAPRQPDPGRPGRVPPPHCRHRLRALSELGVVRFADGAEVLLPGDVPRHLEQPGPQPDHALRRGLPGAGGRDAPRLSPAQRAAADTYIAERNAKRVQCIGIPKHALYNGCAGVMTFAGLRRIDDEALALLRHGGADEIQVLPVDAATARRLSRVALGEALTVTPRGTMAMSKGRSR